MANTFSGTYDYGYSLQPFVAGQVTDISDQITMTGSCLTTCIFGLVMVHSVLNPGYVELPSAGNVNFAGVIQSFPLDPIQAGSPMLIPVKTPLPILRRGKIAVQIDDNVTTVLTTDPVYVRVTDTDAGKKPGQVLKTNANSSVLLPGARFTGRIIAGKLAEISILMAS